MAKRARGSAVAARTGAAHADGEARDVPARRPQSQLGLNDARTKRVLEVEHALDVGSELRLRARSPDDRSNTDAHTNGEARHVRRSHDQPALTTMAKRARRAWATASVPAGTEECSCEASARGRTCIGRGTAPPCAFSRPRDRSRTLSPQAPGAAGPAGALARARSERGEHDARAADAGDRRRCASAATIRSSAGADARGMIEARASAGRAPAVPARGGFRYAERGFDDRCGEHQSQLGLTCVPRTIASARRSALAARTSSVHADAKSARVPARRRQSQLGLNDARAKRVLEVEHALDVGLRLRARRRRSRSITDAHTNAPGRVRSECSTTNMHWMWVCASARVLSTARSITDALPPGPRSGRAGGGSRPSAQRARRA
jgi:hypothetical protein